MYEGNAARKLYGEDLAPGYEVLAKERLGRLRAAEARGAEAIKPTAVIPFPQGQVANNESAPPREPEELPNLRDQKVTASRWQQLARQRQAVYRQAGKIQTAKNLAQKYKQIRNILRIAKIGTGITVAGLIITVLVAHGEWIYHKFNNNYPFTKLDKILTLAADGIILLALVAGMFIVYLQLHPLEAIKFGIELL